MSTLTTNYGLSKPDLTDPADITKMNPNWDKIDETLKKHADHKHTAKDVGAVTQEEMNSAITSAINSAIGDVDVSLASMDEVIG